MDVDFIKYRFEDGHDGVITKKKFKIGVRHLQMFYTLVCCAVFGALRASNGIAVLAINDRSRQNDTYIQIHEWNGKKQGAILSSFMFGYALTLLPAELYLQNVKSKLLITVVLLVNGVLCVALPIVVNRGGWVAVCNCELLMGMTHACLIPSNRALVAKWLPPSERPLFSGLVYSGVQLGIAVGVSISGLLTKTDLGWELIFYSEAMMTISMAIVWGLLTASTPKQHQAIGDTEKEFITEALGVYRKRCVTKPWREMIASRQLWAVACAHAASNALFVFFLYHIPAYLHALGFSLSASGLAAACPLVSMCIMYVTTSPTLEWLHNIGFVGYLFTSTCYRKLLNGLGALGIIAGLTIVSNLGPESRVLAVVMLTMILGFLGFQYSGFLETLKDMSPNFSGTLLMMTSFVANLVGAGTPFICGLALDDDLNDLKRWQKIFLTLATFTFICNIVYTFFGRSDRQQWDVIKKNQKFAYFNQANQLELEDLENSQDKSNQSK